MLYSGRASRFCADVTLDPTFTADAEVTYLLWHPEAASLCCSDTCYADIERWEAELRAHEQEHVNDAAQIAQDATRQWSGRVERVCAANKKQLEAILGNGEQLKAAVS